MKEEDRKDKSRVHLRIEGMVQGVFFRCSAVEEAVRLRLSGWVRNCPDGSVEVVAEGPRQTIEDLIRWCHHGPPGAHVLNVQIQREDYKGEFENFHITR